MHICFLLGCPYLWFKFHIVFITLTFLSPDCSTAIRQLARLCIKLCRDIHIW
jgi:hypothetical protein